MQHPAEEATNDETGGMSESAQQFGRFRPNPDPAALGHGGPGRRALAARPVDDRARLLRRLVQRLFGLA